MLQHIHVRLMIAIKVITLLLDNTVVSNSIKISRNFKLLYIKYKISRNFKLLYIRNGFQIQIPRPKYACAENFKYIRQREWPL